MNPLDVDRPVLRRRLLAERAALEPAAATALHAQLSRHLLGLLNQLQPELLGAYVAIRNEFNALAECLADTGLHGVPFALPFCLRDPRRMDYRRWDCGALTLHDECKIPTASGAVCVPDVLVVPCVGFTASGFRLGYGGGYFDRYLAAHPQVTAIGVAMAAAALSEAELAPQPHDKPLTLIVTERGVV